MTRQPRGSLFTQTVSCAPPARREVPDRDQASAGQGGVVAEEGSQAFQGEADDVGPTAAGDADERVVVLETVGAGLALPAAGIEVGEALGVGQGTEAADA